MARSGCSRGGAAAWLAALTVAGAAGCGPNLGVPPAVCSTTAVDVGHSAEMEPGGDCIQCHRQYYAPSFQVAGTVMASLHDDTNCAGVAGVAVRLTGSDGNVLEMRTNGTGNFYALPGEFNLLPPFRAEVIANGKSNAMMMLTSDRDCANCHTATGANGAPGRIIPPTP